MIKTTILFFYLGCLPLLVNGQIYISGIVKDAVTNERLIGANIVEQGTSNGTVSDNRGYFSLRLAATADIRVSYVGYQPGIISITKDSLMEIPLNPDTELGEVVVTASRPTQPNVVTLNSIELNQIPSLGGKPDVIKAAQLLPGIQTQKEGSSLMMVRGGNPGENLYMLDNVPLIYVNHIGGFMSVFNPDMINGMDIYKGGFPARFGGKLSSIIDITQREGDMSGLKGSFSAGITDLSFSVEGPTKLKNSSFIVTGRKTLTEALTALATGVSDANSFVMMYGFHDINAKFSWKPDTRNSIHVNLYQGDDYLHYHSKKDAGPGKSRMNNVWGNWLVSARWNHMASAKLFSSTSFSYTRYRLRDSKKYDHDNGQFERKFISSVRDVSLRSDWKYLWMKDWTLNFGIQSSLLVHDPNDTWQTNLQNNYRINTLYATVNALYLENRFRLFDIITLDAGGRAVYYGHKDYPDFSVEPRLKLNAGITKNNSLNASYMQVGQYSHLLFTAGNITNNEVWVPASKDLPGARSTQYTVGWTGSFYKDMFRAEIDLYYKKSTGLATYREGFTSLMGDTDWQSKVIAGGKGESKGIEMLIRKTKGNWTGFASYALSKTTRKYPEINDGKEYIYDYDRTHSLSLFVNKRINDKWNFNLAWVYMTGLPYTPAIGRQIMSYGEDGEYYEAMIYGDRNSARMAAYHRLDAGLSYTKTTKRNRKAVWTFSIYNLYNRQNPYFYYYNQSNSSELWKPGYYDGENHSMKMYSVGFFPVIPTISYKLYFDRNAQKAYKKSLPPKEKRALKKKLHDYFFLE